MYSVKQSGRNGFAWYDIQMEQQIQARVVLEEEIRAAIEADEFVPFFQPLISLDSGELNGFEVLARWKSPRRGLIEPAEFIGIAEQSGQISALSMRVMEKAFIEARDWPTHLKLAVNVSPVQFRDPRLAERVVKILTETGFSARRLEVEITEGSLMEDREQALTIIHKPQECRDCDRPRRFRNRLCLAEPASRSAVRPDQDRSKFHQLACC